MLFTQLLPELPSALVPTLVFSGSVTVAWIRPTRVPQFLPLAFLAAGVAWASFYGHRLVEQQLPLELERKTLTVSGTVDGLPRTGTDHVRFDFKVDHASRLGKAVKIPFKIRLSAYGAEWKPKAGDRWQLAVRLRRPHGFQNPGGFDYEAYLFSRRIRATGYVAMRQPPVYLGRSVWSGSIDRVRESISARINQALGPDPQTGFLMALAIGDQQRIQTEQWNILRRTGTSHLVAISGLHLSLVSGLIFLLVQWAWKRFEYGCLRLPAQKVAALSAMVFALVYAALAGFSVPTQRALVMLIVGYGSLLLSRQPIRARIIAVAMLCVLLYDPLAVISPGFWLSFTAVGIILYVTIGRITGRRFINGLRIQWAISLGLIPLTLLFFQTASIVSPIANLLAIPVFALLVVPATLLAVLVLPFTALSQSLLKIAATFSFLGWSWIEQLDRHVPVDFHAAAPGALAIVCSLLGLAMMGLPSGFPGRWLGALWCLPLLWAPAKPSPGAFQLTLLDVGQGLSTVVQTKNHTLLFDTGARFSPDFDTGTAVIIPFLRSRGIRYLDTVVISHGDTDHIGGYASVSEGTPVRRLISNVEKLNAPEPCLAGKKWEWDNVRFKILHPAQDAIINGNNGSCVLQVSGKWGTALLTADIEKQSESLLVKRYGNSLRSDVMIAPHHGSQTSSSDIFLSAVDPKWILVPAGHLNRYRHPAKKVIRRYSRKKHPWRVSGVSGAITVDFNQASLTPVLYRNQYKRYWHNIFYPEQEALIARNKDS